MVVLPASMCAMMPMLRTFVEVAEHFLCHYVLFEACKSVGFRRLSPPCPTYAGRADRRPCSRRGPAARTCRYMITISPFSTGNAKRISHQR